MIMSPALTLCPSRTWIARTTPVSNGWIILVRPLGMILPGAVATISVVPSAAHPNATQNSTMIVTPTIRRVGDGGVSTISNAAGRKASSSSRRRTGACGNGMIFLTDVMDSSLQIVEFRITTVTADQLIMVPSSTMRPRSMVMMRSAVAHGRQTVGNDEHGSAAGDLLHVLLDYPLALIIERTRGLVKNQNARIGDEGASDRNALALPP